jgi:transmembrane sensor
MKGNLPTDNAKAIEVEAASWIAQLSDGEFSDSDKLALREWCARSPVHRNTLQRLGRLWAEFDALETLREEQPAVTEKSRLRWNPFWIGHAATAGIGMLALIAWLAFRPTTELGDAPLQMFATQVGEQQVFDLADGSFIHLNTDSLVEVDYGAYERRVRLVRGEAIFKVASDASRAFRVYAGSAMVQAVGTRFSVELKQDAVEVIVSEGRVSLNRPGATGGGAPSYFLDQNQWALIGEGSADALTIEAIDPAVIQRHLSWTTGMLEFDGEPLAEVVYEVSRYTAIRIEVTDPDLRAMRVGGRFRTGDTKALFEVIETGFGATVTQTEDVVLISAN